MGITSQDVRATATAQVITGNAVECMKPWAIADKWDENWENGAPNTGPWTPDSVFDKYKKQGSDMVPDPAVTTPDVYIAPTATDPGTGFTPFDADGNPTADYGLQLTLKIGSFRGPSLVGLVPGARSAERRRDSSGSGGADYRNNIANCNRDRLPDWRHAHRDSEQGNMVGPTKQGVEGGGPGGMGLTQKDPGATWNASTKSFRAAARRVSAPTASTTRRSPRIVPVPLFDIDAFFAGSPNGKTSVTITNIMGFFIEGMGGSGQQGRHRPARRDSRPDAGRRQR